MEKKNFTILYVDDEEQNLISFKAAFRRDYKIITALSGFEGLEVLEKNDVHLVITDQRMPKMTGTQFLEKVIPKYPNTIRMVITGYSDVEAIIDAINKGRVFRYVIKPWDDNELRMTIDNAFQLFSAQMDYKELLEDLQNKVKERTLEIEQQKEEILSQRDHLEDLNKELMLQKEEIVFQNKNITSSIQYAKRIQQAILPTEKFVKTLFPESFILFKPKDIVSGDFYWFMRKDTKIFFAAVDCTGHGVPGAFMSIVGNNMLQKSLEGYNFESPAEVLNDLSDQIHVTLRKTTDEFGVKDGMDLALCAYDPFNKELQYSGAFNPLYIIRNGELIEEKADNYPIGEPFGEDFRSYKNTKINLQEGDLIYIFSDGFIDQFGGKQQRKFMRRRFKETLLSISQLSMSQQKEELAFIFESWKGNLDQIDDVLVIGIKIV